MKLIDIELSDTSPARKMRDIMCKLWSNFAKTGNPGNEIWKPIENASELNYLILDTELKMEKNVNGKRMNFWRKIYKTWNKDFLKPKL
jgi:carboxylesterase type B